MGLVRMCVVVSLVDRFQPSVNSARAYVGVCSDLVVPVFTSLSPDFMDDEVSGEGEL